MIKQNCLQTFNEYLCEMLQWEEKWNEAASENVKEIYLDENVLLRRKGIELIFDKFLSKKALAEGQSRLTTLHFGNPPEHEVTVSRVKAKGKWKYQIFAENKKIKIRMRFDMILANDAWKLDAKAYSSQNWKTQRTIF